MTFSTNSFSGSVYCQTFELFQLSRWLTFVELFWSKNGSKLVKIQSHEPKSLKILNLIIYPCKLCHVLEPRTGTWNARKCHGQNRELARSNLSVINLTPISRELNRSKLINRFGIYCHKNAGWLSVLYMVIVRYTISTLFYNSDLERRMRVAHFRLIVLPAWQETLKSFRRRLDGVFLLFW